MIIIISSILVFCALFYCISVLYLFTGLFRLKSPDNDKLNKISVIIAVHNEENTLKECLEGIVAQNYPRDKFEVIIADDRSTDRTPEIIKEYCAKYDNFSSVTVALKEVAVPKKTALARAIEQAQGDIVLTTDGDCVHKSGWIRSMNLKFTDNIGLVIGHVEYFKPANIWAGIDSLDYLTHRALGAAFLGVKSIYTCTAANMAFRKDIFMKNRDSFNALTISPAEDNFFLHCTRKEGFKIVTAVDQDSIVYTGGAANFSHFMNQRFRWAAYGGNIMSMGVTLFFIPALLFYAAILVSLGAALVLPKIIVTTGYVFLVKMLCDFLLICKYTSIYKNNYLLKYFIPLSFIHLILAPLVALKGNISSFTWKNKKYTKDGELRE